MRSPAVIEVEVTANRSTGLADAVVGSQIHLLVFDDAPQPLDEDVVPPGTLDIHADGDDDFDQHAANQERPSQDDHAGPTHRASRRRWRLPPSRASER